VMSHRPALESMIGSLLAADLRDEHLGRQTHVKREQPARPIGVAADRRFHHLAQFGNEVASAGHGRRCAPVVAKFLDLQHLPHSPEPYAVAARYQVIEKRVVKRHESSIETPLGSRSQGRRSRQLMEGSDDACFPAYIARGDGVPQAQFFDFNARGGQIAQILRRNRRDAKTALRPRLHQALGSEPRKRLAYCALTSLELLTQLPDAQRITGFETTVQEGVSKLIVGMLSQARRSAGRSPGRCRFRGFGSDVSSPKDPKKYILKRKVYTSILWPWAERASPYSRRI
jgi:hypothetical protein